MLKKQDVFLSKMKHRKESKNIYQLPFHGDMNITPSPHHYERAWQINAVDFALDVGTSLFASEDGLVHKVIDGYDKGGHDEKFLNECNLVMIEHLNEEFSGYAHFRKGILVKEGQQVKAGEIIGYSGQSGFAGYPHLHYQTMVRDPNGGFGGWTTIPTRFQIGDEVKTLISPKDGFDSPSNQELIKRLKS